MKKYILVFVWALVPFASAQSLTHRYSFDSDVTDSVGGAHGTLENGATVNEGQLVLSGGDSLADGGNFASLPGGDIGINTYSAVTMEAWLTPSSANSTFAMAAVFGRHYSGYPDEPDGGDPNGFTDNWAGYQYLMLQPTRADAAEGARAAITRERFELESGVNRGSQLNDDLEHHVVISVDATDLSFYLDGTLVGSTPIGDNTLDTLSNNQAYLGASVYQFDATFQGSYNDFRLWDGAFSADQVATSFVLGPNEVIPEPSTYALLLGGIAMAGVIVWRRRHQA